MANKNDILTRIANIIDALGRRPFTAEIEKAIDQLTQSWFDIEREMTQDEYPGIAEDAAQLTAIQAGLEKDNASLTKITRTVEEIAGLISLVESIKGKL